MIIIALTMSNTLAMSIVVAKTIPLISKNIPRTNMIWVKPVRLKTMKIQNRIAVIRSIVPSNLTATMKIAEDKGF